MNNELECTVSSATNHTDDTINSLTPTKAAVLSPPRKARSNIPSLEVSILSNNSKVIIFLPLITHSFAHLHTLIH